MKKFRKSKNKKGFTFVELLSVIVILSILATIGIATANHFLSSAKEKYYKSQEGLITLAGKQYFTDYRNELPKEIGEKTYVTIETLYSKKYLDKVVNNKSEKYDLGETYYYLSLLYKEYSQLENIEDTKKEEYKNKSEEAMKKSKELGYKSFIED